MKAKKQEKSVKKSGETAETVLKWLEKASNKERALVSLRFFKTGKGEYGEGDQFLGITVPDIRILVRNAGNMALPEVGKLLQSKWHEARLFGVLSLVKQYEKSDEKAKKKIFDFYIGSRKGVNNWDLVDTSTPNIVGEYIFSHREEIDVIDKFSRSKNLWERRMAMLSMFSFIRRGESELPLQMAERFLSDKEDLMHKATGWMLREVGKRCGEASLTGFLDMYAPEMPRTMLRYAIERLSPRARMHYLKQKSRV